MVDLEMLSAALKRPGYSKTGLAKALGKAPSAVTLLVRGERRIMANEVPLIEAYLNSSIRASVAPGDTGGAMEALEDLARTAERRFELLDQKERHAREANDYVAAEQARVAGGEAAMFAVNVRNRIAALTAAPKKH